MLTPARAGVAIRQRARAALIMMQLSKGGGSRAAGRATGGRCSSFRSASGGGATARQIELELTGFHCLSAGRA